MHSDNSETGSIQAAEPQATERRSIAVLSENAIGEHRTTLEATSPISSYYDDTVIDYHAWSKEGYLHFGYWRPWLNPFSRKPMLEEMNRLIFKHLRLERFGPQAQSTRRPAGQTGEGAIADLGCGVGAVSRHGSRLFPHVAFHAVTLSPGQVAEAKKRQVAERVTYYCGDYHKLPLPDASLDGVFFLESLCHSTCPEEALSEAARVLKPGGRIVLTDGYLRRPIEKTSPMFRYVIKAVAHNWAVPMFHEIDKAKRWNCNGQVKLVEEFECGWRLGPSALHTAHLSLIQLFKLLFTRGSTDWQWRHLTASAFTIALGLYRRHFRYHLLTFERQ